MSATESDRGQASILLIDDDPGTIQVLRRALAEYRDVRFATGGEEGVSLALALVPDLILLDAEMPGLNGIATLRRIKAQPELDEVAVMFVTSHDQPELEIEALELGAVDFLTKPVNANLLRARVRTQLRLKFLTDQLRLAARRDGLTGLANRRELDDRLNREWRRALRSGEPLSVILLDVDHFKRYNDSMGHQAGDEALRSVADVLREQAHRGGDLPARYGGEEFLVILPNTSADSAVEVAERVRAHLATKAIPHPDSPTAKYLTVSAGVSTLPPQSDFVETLVGRISPEALVERADVALYEAKRGGRDRVVHRSYQVAS